MNNTTHPETFRETLERMGLADLLETFIAPKRGRRWGFNEVERFARQNGYVFVREAGNVYGALKLVPATPAPVLRIITRSDHAAVFPSRHNRRAAFREGGRKNWRTCDAPCDRKRHRRAQDSAIAP